MPLSADVPGWDMFKNTGTNLHDIVAFNHTSLVRQNHGPGCGAYPTDPELAQGWKWLSDRSLELKLKQGVKYQDLPPMNGREFVASDVVFTIEKQWPKMSWYKPITDAIDKIEAPDKYTVRINLKSPFAVFPDKAFMANVANIVAPEIFEGKADLVRQDQNVGLGPFVLTSYVIGVKATQKRSPNYATIRPGLPYLDGLDQYVIPDSSSQAAALRAGKLDFGTIQWEPAVIRDLQRTAPNLGSQVCPFETPPAITMRADKPPFNDVRVRRAISMAVDREALIRSVYVGMAWPTYSSITSMLGDYHLPQDKLPADIRRYVEYHPDDAKKLLTEAGYPDGFETTVIFTPRYGSVHRGISEAMVDYLGKIGIKAKIEVREYGRYLDSVLAGGNYEGMSTLWPSSAGDPDTPLWDTHHSTSTGRNRSHVNDPKMDKLLEAQRAAVDDAQRREIVYEAQRYWAQQLYYISFPQVPYAAFYQPYVKDVYHKAYDNKAKDDYMVFIWLDK